MNKIFKLQQNNDYYELRIILRFLIIKTIFTGTGTEQEFLT